MGKTVLVVGTGTIGEPLIGLISDFREDLDVEEVLFYKRTPLVEEVPKVNSLCTRGAKLVASDIATAARFSELGNEAHMLFPEALAQSDVVVDCTPAGNQNKTDFYENYAHGSKPRLFIAQGSEKGFGVPYAYGVNEEALTEGTQWIQVVSCNTHSIACLIRTLSDEDTFVSGDFVCMRRANDVSQDIGYVASTTVGSHKDPVYGTHHARDVRDLLSTVEMNVDVFSSALKISTQYMHAVRFNITVSEPMTKSGVINIMSNNPLISLTHKTSANKIFSFGRDHGYYGRIYNHVVVPQKQIEIYRNETCTRIVGFCFTPQDGNSLITSLAAVAHHTLGPDSKNLSFIDRLLFQRV